MGSCSAASGVRRQPDVSVVIPTYNRRSLLEKAVTSCFEGNDAVEVEVIVVDDGSTDGTREFLEELTDDRIHPVFQKSQGPQAARNKGMKKTTGQYIKFLDDDDWLASGALADEVSLLQETGADVCHGRLRMWAEEEEDMWPIPEKYSIDAASTILKEGMCTIPLKYLFSRTVIDELTWDEDLPYHQDYAFLIDAACRGLKFTDVGRTVGIRRRHEGPRIDDVKAEESRAEYHSLKVTLIGRGVRLLEKNGLLQPHHRRAAAAGIWTWAHIVAGYDLDAFESFMEEIQKIAPDFRPDRERTVLKVLDFLLGVEGTERCLYPVRRLKNDLRKTKKRAA